MTTLVSIFQDWQRDERGSITIEFMLWTPVLCFWLVVSAAFFDAYKSRSDASKAAHVLSDITSRQTEVTNAFLNDLYVLQDNLLSRAPDGTKARVSSIQYVAADNSYQVLWSQPLGGGVALDVSDVPRAILPSMADLDTVILTELAVPYEPFSGWPNIEVTEWSFALASRPRFVSSIAITP